MSNRLLPDMGVNRFRFLPGGDEERSMEETKLPAFSYYLDELDTDILTLQRQDGSFVAAFCVSSITRDAIVEVAKGDYRALARGYLRSRGEADDTESGCTLPSMSEKGKSGEPKCSQLEVLYRKESDRVRRTHLFMVWRMLLGDSIQEVAGTSGYSEKWVREIARRYESEGVEGLGDRRHGNPGARERALLDEEGQAELSEALLEGSPPGGGLWSGPKVARWIQERTGVEKVHDQRGWEYLRKVGHTPQAPRLSNSRADASERAAFKKRSSARLEKLREAHPEVAEGDL
jgi:transposase